MSGDNILIGAYTESHDIDGQNSVYEAGSAYLFKQSSVVTGIDNTISSGITIYPNPVKNKIKISSIDDLNWKISNSEGKILIKGNSKNIDMTNFSPGIYFFSTATGISKKIIKQ